MCVDVSFSAHPAIPTLRPSHYLAACMGLRASNASGRRMFHGVMVVVVLT